MKKPHTVDAHVGARLRRRRIQLGMTQEKLGAAVGLTFQQIQKYEQGSRRIGSSRLHEFAKVLGISVSYFFDKVPSDTLSDAPMSRSRKGARRVGKPVEEVKDPLIKRETLELVRAYYDIRSERVRKRIVEMIKAEGAESHAKMPSVRKKR